jgi:hypothetical protein
LKAQCSLVVDWFLLHPCMPSPSELYPELCCTAHGPWWQGPHELSQGACFIPFP